MIKPSELRIGNYANYKFWNPNPKNPNWEFSRVEIVGVLKDNFYFKTENDNRTAKIGELHPIPITEEWLLKFGFTNGVKVDGNGQTIDITLSDNEFFLGGFDACISGQCFMGNIKYVHQLQNLYFSLTNTELIWNVK